MTASPDTPALHFATVTEAMEAIRSAGFRLSTPRRLILEALFTADGPVSAAHLARDLSIDESSAYRNLEMLEEAGVVRHVHLGHSPGLYGLVTAGEVEYLYCQRCSRVTAVAPERLDGVRNLIHADFGFQAHFTHFAIAGICATCSTQPPDATGDRDGLHSHGDHVHAHAGSVPHGHGHDHSSTNARHPPDISGPKVMSL
jgi:Fur family ferric uptake transcriptional regulator